MEDKNAIKDLTDLQTEIGYTNTGINSIAILGLFGEAGEVLESWYLLNKESIPKSFRKSIEEAVRIAGVIDQLKKDIRDQRIAIPGLTGKFDNETLLECSDVAYYLNAVATNIDSSFEGLAAISVEKVRNRVAMNIEHGIDHLEMPNHQDVFRTTVEGYNNVIGNYVSYRHFFMSETLSGILSDLLQNSKSYLWYKILETGQKLQLEAEKDGDVFFDLSEKLDSERLYTFKREY